VFAYFPKVCRIKGTDPTNSKVKQKTRNADRFRILKRDFLTIIFFKANNCKRKTNGKSRVHVLMIRTLVRDNKRTRAYILVTHKKP
jgi:hypothetical protein